MLIGVLLLETIHQRFWKKKINHLVVERLEDALQSLQVLSHAL